MGDFGVRVLDDGWTAVTSDGSLSAHFEHTVAFKRVGQQNFDNRVKWIETFLRTFEVMAKEDVIEVQGW